MAMIIIIQLSTAIACYFIGVMIGRQTAEAGKKSKRKEKRNPVEIQHVGYDDEQCGREK